MHNQKYAPQWMKLNQLSILLKNKDTKCKYTEKEWLVANSLSKVNVFLLPTPLISFACFWTLHKWNYIIYTLFFLDAFHKYSVCEIIYVAPCINSLFILWFTDLPCSIALSFIVPHRYCIFYRLRLCDNPVSRKSIYAIFPTSLTHFMSLCHTLVILTVFQTFLLLLYFL